MNFKYSLVALAAAASFSAQAAVIVLDDFNLTQAVTTASTAAQKTVTGGTNFDSRTLNVTAGASDPLNPNIVISGGGLRLGGTNLGPYNATATWTFNAAVLGALANSTWSITLRQDSLDETVTVGGNLRTASQTGSTVTLASGNGSGTLNPFAVTFAAAVNHDSTWSLLIADYTCNTGFTIQRDGTCGRAATVPEPGTIALLGLGLLGAGALRRKVK